MRNVLFSTEDPLGDDSNVIHNFKAHASRKTHYGSWGADVHTQKLFPRGKAYDRLWSLQFDCYMVKVFDI